MGEELSINLASSLLAFAAGWLVRNLVHYYRTRKPAARLWRLDLKKKTVIVVGESRGGSPRYAKIPEPDALAAMNLRQFLAQDLRVHTATIVRAGAFDMAADAEVNLVVIGGPAHNPLWNLLTGRLAAPVEFRRYDSGARIGLVGGDEEFGESEREDGSSVDHAIVLLARNPFAPRSRLILVAGCGTLATTGASHLFSRGSARELVSRFDVSSPVALVVSVESVAGYVAKPVIVAAVPFDQPSGVLGVRTPS
ncbi:hypothetical protein [Streptomyces sp. NPDC002276]